MGQNKLNKWTEYICRYWAFTSEKGQAWFFELELSLGLHSQARTSDFHFWSCYSWIMILTYDILLREEFDPEREEDTRVKVMAPLSQWERSWLRQQLSFAVFCRQMFLQTDNLWNEHLHVITFGHNTEAMFTVLTRLPQVRILFLKVAQAGGRTWGLFDFRLFFSLNCSA